MKSLAYLNKFFWKYRWRFLLGFLFIIASNIITVRLPLILRDAINDFEVHFAGYSAAENQEAYFADIIIPIALTVILYYVLLSLLKGLFVFLMRQTIIIMSRYIEYDLKQEIYQQYQRLSLSFYKRNRTGDLMNRISEDVSRSRMYLGPAVMYSLNLTSLFVIVLYYMFSINTELALYALIPLPIMSVLIYLVSNTMNKRSERVQHQQSRLTSIVQETFSGIRIIKSYNRQKKYANDFAAESEQYKVKSMRLVRINAFFMPIIILIIGISTALVIYVGGLQTIDGDMKTADIFLFIMYIGMLTWPFASIGWVTSIVQRAAASQERINEFLNEEPEIVSGSVTPSDVKGEIVFEHVSFTYPDSGIEALKNISFKIAPGKTLAVIGKTGSGKSTLAELIGRLYDVTSGKILIDGKDLRELNSQAFRSYLGYVPQEVFLFSDTIANNIRFGINNRDVPVEEIELAAKQAHIHHNIVDFAEGYETVLGERGITLSGGQKQRISIARAIIRQPQILIFDDCLSAVDTETEEIILRHLKTIMEDKTTIIISHRISAIQHADEIVVLENGSIIEKGTHSELLKLQGSYYDLYQKQLTQDHSHTSN